MRDGSGGAVSERPWKPGDSNNGHDDFHGCAGEGSAISNVAESNSMPVLPDGLRVGQTRGDESSMSDLSFWGKVYQSTFTGSMMGAGSDVFAVWSYCLAYGRRGHVELNPKLLSMQIGMPEERVKAAIEFLAAPDPASRSAEEKGRRIVYESGFSYRIVNWRKYNPEEETRRQYWAQKQAESRARKKGLTQGNNVPHRTEPEHTASNDLPVTLPKTFPKTEEDAVAHAVFIGVPAEFARQVWHQAMGRGGRDGAGVPINDWRHHLKGRWIRKQSEDAEKGPKGEAREIQEVINVKTLNKP